MNWLHIYPENDLITHTIYAHGHDTFICQCNPVTDKEAKLIIHEAMDQRAIYEKEG